MRRVLAFLCVVALSGFLLHHHHGGGGQAPVSTALSGTSFASGQASGTYIGTLSTNMSPVSPVFSGTNSLVASGGSCSGGDTTDFQIVGDAVETAGTPAAGTYTICVKATQGSLSLTTSFTITAGHLITATSYCAANGGGNGTSGSPWQAACIQAAANAAVAGDTVQLAAGNWALNTANSPVTITTAINLVGAGSGTTFSAAGNPSNASGTDLCPTSSSSVTCVATTGTSNVNTSPGGWLRFSSCGNGSVTVAHIFFDGSLVTAGGDARGTLNFLNCFGASVVITLNDIRLLGFDNTDISQEAQLSFQTSNNAAVQNSVIATPHYTGASVGNLYSAAGPFFDVVSLGLTINNTFFFEAGLPPIDVENFVITGSTILQGQDGAGYTYGTLNSAGATGCGIGPGSGCLNGGHNGTYGITFTNNYMQATGVPFGVGGGLNDAGTGGGLNGITFTGNTVVAATAAIDTCVWHYYNPSTGVEGCPPAGQATSASWSANVVTFVVPNALGMSSICPGGSCNSGSIFGTAGFSPSGYNTPQVPNPPITWWVATTEVCSGGNCTITASDTTALGAATTLGMVSLVGGSEGMQINGTVNNDCSESSTPSAAFTTTNNSIIGTTAAVLNASAAGMMGCRLGAGLGGGVQPHTNTVVGFTAQKNYLSSPNNAYVSSVNTITPTVSNNYGLDVSSGFTTPPTASFTLGLLYYDFIQAAYAVPFATTNFTAQYGAVQWLASTSPTTPASGDARWSYVPPVYLSGVAHGNTVYLWTMDSLNHISARASALIP